MLAICHLPCLTLHSLLSPLTTCRVPPAFCHFPLPTRRHCLQRTNVVMLKLLAISRNAMVPAPLWCFNVFIYIHSHQTLAKRHCCQPTAAPASRSCLARLPASTHQSTCIYLHYVWPRTYPPPTPYLLLLLQVVFCGIALFNETVTIIQGIGYCISLLFFLIYNYLQLKDAGHCR